MNIDKKVIVNVKFDTFLKFITRKKYVTVADDIIQQITERTLFKYVYLQNKTEVTDNFFEFF